MADKFETVIKKTPYFEVLPTPACNEKNCKNIGTYKIFDGEKYKILCPSHFEKIRKKLNPRKISSRENTIELQNSLKKNDEILFKSKSVVAPPNSHWVDNWKDFGKKKKTTRGNLEKKAAIGLLKFIVLVTPAEEFDILSKPGIGEFLACIFRDKIYAFSFDGFPLLVMDENFNIEHYFSWVRIEDWKKGAHVKFSEDFYRKRDYHGTE